MLTLKSFLEKSYSEIILLSIIFLFFFQLIADLVGVVFALNLLTTSLTAYALLILFLFSPLVLLFFKKTSNLFLVIVGEVLIVSRLVESLIPLAVIRAIFAGIGIGAFMIFLPAYLTKFTPGLVINRFEKKALNLGLGLAFGLSLSIFFRTLGISLDITTIGWFQVFGWILGIIASVMLIGSLFISPPLPVSDTNSDERLLPNSSFLEEKSNDITPSKRGFGKILGLSFGIIFILVMLYYTFSSPTVIARAVEGNYIAIVTLLMVMILSYTVVFLLKPHFISKLKPWVLWLWNSLFVINYTVMFALYQPQVAVLRQIMLYLMVLLSPIILIDFTLLIRELLQCRPTTRKIGGSFLIGVFIFVITIFSYIFTITYDYIPVVGPFFRDKHWLVMMIVALFSILPILIVKKGSLSFSITFSPLKLRKKVLVSIIAVIFLGTIVSVIATSPFPRKPAESLTSFKVVTFNVQQGYDIEGNLNFSGILADLRAIDADIIGLQESDTCRISSINTDIVRFLAANLHLYSYYGPMTITGTFGIALLSKYPILNAQTHFMYSEGEQTATIEAQIVIQATTYNIFVSHFGEHANDRLQQAGEIVELVTGKSNAILIGDFNFRPWTEPYNITTGVINDAWLLFWPTGIDDLGYTGLTNNWQNPTGRIDYIFISPEITLSDCRVVRDAYSSDHMPVTVTITV
ncbi:MAG: endonuclease/exonuclease/phosphatase family protein [Candidatus Heimdallarchaeota archaeon]|nr:endonuclease/exonuclease/phosphatase family protein [Candidatus Heimdallarchaeota archaeon]